MGARENETVLSLVKTITGLSYAASYALQTRPRDDCTVITYYAHRIVWGSFRDLKEKRVKAAVKVGEMRMWPFGIRRPIYFVGDTRDFVVEKKRIDLFLCDVTALKQIHDSLIHYTCS